MILLIPILIGFIACLARVWLREDRLTFPALYLEWLALVAFIPQFLVFYWPATAGVDSTTLVGIALVISQMLLFVFAWANRKQPGFWALGLGLVLNLLVIVLNGGLMPISPEMASWLTPHTAPDLWTIGNRFGTSKDIILPVDETYLWFLSDRFYLSISSLYRVAFSAGDVLIAWGAFWFMWALGEPQSERQEQNFEQIISLAK